MPWAKVDDTAHEHRKFKRAGLEATGLYWMALSYCARYLTDGHVDQHWLEERVPQRSRREKLLHALTEQRLFEENGNGYYVHDYHDYNPPAARVRERRRKELEKKRNQRMSRGDNGGDNHGDE